MKNMKGKSFISFLCICASLLYFNNTNAQIANKNIPTTKFNVHRQYDDKGNLIEYDSTSEYTWQSDSINNNFNSSAENGGLNKMNPSVDSNSIDNQMRSLFGFEFSDKNFFSPTFPNIEDFFRGLDNNNSSPDSNAFTSPLNQDTIFFYNSDPFTIPLDKDYEARMREMQNEINNYMQGLINQQKKKENPHKKSEKPVERAYPDLPDQKEPADNTIHGNIIDI
jgi:hypothetical protein